MNQATNVNIVPSYGQRGDLHFSQYDVGRTATINLYAVNEAYTIPVGATVKIQATKPSGLGFDVACTFSGSVVTVVSTETMTEEAGRFPCELRITKDSDVIGTANFMFVVEPSPHPDGTVDGDAEEVVNEIKALVLQSEGWALGTQDGVPVDSSSPYYENNAKWFAEHPQSLTDDFKQALLDCFQNVAWTDGDGQDYYDALYNALYSTKTLISISAVYTQSGTVYEFDSLDSLKTDLVVTAIFSDASSEVVNGYTLSGTLADGTSTITVTYGGKTDTFTVTVKGLPSAYTAYDYITFNGSQYANSGVYESASMLSAEYKFRRTDTDSGSPNRHVYSSTNIYYPYASIETLNAQWKAKYNGTEKGFTYQWNTSTDYTVVYDADLGNVHINNTLASSSITQGSTYSASNQLTIGTYGGAVGTTKYRFNGRIYYIKLYNSSGVAHYFQPAERNNDNVFGFYDIVTDNFKTATAGTFTGGNL